MGRRIVARGTSPKVAALFAEAGPDAQALSFQVQTHTAALDEGGIHPRADDRSP
jgi:hypothetical protein